MALKILRSAIRRPGDVGIDLPAGATASKLHPEDVHLVDMEPEDRVRPEVVGMDLPAGASAEKLRPEDYGSLVTEKADS